MSYEEQIIKYKYKKQQETNVPYCIKVQLHASVQKMPVEVEVKLFDFHKTAQIILFHRSLDMIRGLKNRSFYFYQNKKPT